MGKSRAYATACCRHRRHRATTTGKSGATRVADSRATRSRETWTGTHGEGQPHLTRMGMLPGGGAGVTPATAQCGR